MVAIGPVVIVISVLLIVIGFLNGELQSTRKEIKAQFDGLESKLTDLNSSINQIGAGLHDIDRKLENGGKLW